MPTAIRLYGKKQSIPVADDATNEFFSLEESYEINPSRAEASIEKVTIEDNHFVEIVFTDNSTWFGNGNSLKEIFPELKAQSRSAADAPILPVSLSSDDASRSLIGDIALKFLRKFVKKEVKKGIRKVAEELEDKALKDDKQKKILEGLYSLNLNFDLAVYKAPDSKTENQKPNPKTALLFIHGTSSSTKGAFGDLQNSSVWNDTANKYGENIFAFEHRTLTISPFQNVNELIKALPANTNFDLITHSRGGLVGELLMRFCESTDGFMKQSIELFKQEGRTADVKNIEEACATAAKKNIKVRRFVRVACTARGTSLLSERTDIFLNTIINLINISSPILAPIVGGLKMLISETIDSKNSFDELPGLEAQRPDSLVIKALNTYKEYDENKNPVGFENRLAVISGNGKFSLSLNGLKIILTKFFFKWKENDLIVDTVSMYQGAKRKNAVQYFLDNGTDTNHFNYFLNNTTRDALKQALFSNTDFIPTFKEIQGENFDAAAGRGIFGLENGRLAPVKPKGNKPIVILLPGIMGSFLQQGDNSIWINYLRFATGGLTKLLISDTDNIAATGVIKTAYSDLADYLSAKYDVLVFPFDWRRPLEKAGEKLAAQIEELRKEFKVSISLAGHSMGGLVIRDLIINQSSTWKWLNEQPGFRTILLGTPWLGSYRIPHVLSGKDSVIKQLNLIDFANNKTTLINMFAKFPGLLDLLPINDSKDFGSNKLWEDFINASGLSIETVPADLLKNFSAYTKKMKANIDSIDYSNIVYVAGKDKETIKDYKIEDGKLQFYSTAEGDQSVTWESGIPAKIDRSKSLYYTNASHGSLSKKEILFQGILDILLTGSTASHEFSRLPLPVSEGDRSFESREKFEFETSEANIETNILGLDVFATAEETNSPILNISVSNGDLMFARYAVMAGHFAYDDIYNAEDVANTYLKNGLKLKNKLGLYPGPVGSSEFFPNPSDDNDFPGCIIVGLGLSETLNAYQLTLTVEKAVSNYLLTYCKTVVEKQGNSQKKKLGLSTLLIGAGYAGMPIESTCRAIMQGVINGNEKVIAITSLHDLYISELEFIELYEDKSISCFTSINTLIQGNSDGMNLGWAQKAIRKNPGARKRLFTDLTNTWWQRLCVLAENDNSTVPAATKLSFYSSTNNAREEKKEMTNNLKPLESIFEDISTGKQWSFEKAKALFELLIPSYFKENIKRNAPIMWVLDNYTASFPWELLQTGTQKEKPLCVSAGMIRQLAIDDFEQGTAVKSNNVIIIGDPDLNGFAKARQLPGAAREALEVYNLLNLPEYKGQVNVAPPLINANSSRIFVDLYKQDYKIIHIAAHGFFDKKNSQNTGILIGKDEQSGEPIFLTPQFISQLPGTPELVFINCCFLGKVNPYAEELSASRYKLAANIGTELIKKGVKAVVVAGWEVDDTAALAFAKEFYKEMLQGKNFGDAVLNARKYVYKNFGHTNTWGAFQCYGQPQFSLNINAWASNKFEFDIPQQAENKLDTIISKSEVSFYKTDWLMAQLKATSEAIVKAKFTSANLKQLEATAYLELNDYDTAISIFNELFKSETADFKVTSLEIFQNTRVKKAMIDFFGAMTEKKLDDKYINRIVATIDSSIANIESLLAIWETSERYSLIASASKRKACVLSQRPDKKKAAAEMKKALATAAKYYFSGFKILNDSYNFCSWLAVKTFLGLPKTKWQEPYKFQGKEKKEAMSPEIIKRIVKELEEKNTNNTNQLFWNLSQASDVTLCKFLLDPAQKANLTKLIKDFENTWTKTGSVNKKTRQRENIDLLIHFAKITGQKNIAANLEILKQELNAVQ
jgi:CHAT domain-containing protein